MRKPKIRRMKISVSAKRNGASAFAYEVTWDAPEDRALELFAHFQKCVQAMLRADGIST